MPTRRSPPRTRVPPSFLGNSHREPPPRSPRPAATCRRGVSPEADGSWAGPDGWRGGVPYGGDDLATEEAAPLYRGLSTARPRRQRRHLRQCVRVDYCNAQERPAANDGHRAAAGRQLAPVRGALRSPRPYNVPIPPIRRNCAKHLHAHSPLLAASPPKPTPRLPSRPACRGTNAPHLQAATRVQTGAAQRRVRYRARLRAASTLAS